MEKVRGVDGDGNEGWRGMETDTCKWKKRTCQRRGSERMERIRCKEDYKTVVSVQ